MQTIWSTDLDPPSEGLPDDLEDFDILMHVSLGEKGMLGGEVFIFNVTSPSMLLEIESNQFISHTLVLGLFNWESIKKRLEKLLRHATSCKNWDEAIKSLSGYLQYSE